MFARWLKKGRDSQNVYFWIAIKDSSSWLEWLVAATACETRCWIGRKIAFTIAFLHQRHVMTTNTNDLVIQGITFLRKRDSSFKLSFDGHHSLPSCMLESWSICHPCYSCRWIPFQFCCLMQLLNLYFGWKRKTMLHLYDYYDLPLSLHDSFKRWWSEITEVRIWSASDDSTR